MIIDLFHNKIVKDTATDAFVESFNSVLVPMLEDKYGDALEAVTMYEDYLADDLSFEGEWYYPLSVKLEGEDAIIAWIKWPVSKKTFRNNIPYAYIGNDSVDFAFAGFVPTGFADKLQGRRIDYDRNAIKLTVEAVTDDPTLLVGKYSQTFVDELASQITDELCSILEVESFENSTMELQLVFAPGTYLEHTSESVTYRRLLLVDKGCQARDFWVKWTRLNGVGGFRVSDNVNEYTAKFELGEDVPQKIREKEYRFLAGANPSKYQAAMGKKNVTEWRDITKRAIKRGDLVKVASEPVVLPVAEPVSEPVIDTHVQDDVNDQLRALLGSFGVATPATEEPANEPETNEELDIVAELAKSVLATETEEEFEVEIEEVPAVEETVEPIEEPVAEPEVEEPVVEEIVEPTPVVEEIEVAEPEMKSVFDFDFSFDDEPAEEIFSMGGEITLEEYENAVDTAAPVAEKPIDEDAIRREIEAKLRLEYETEARLRAEKEAEQLRIEHERLREENERLAAIAREAEAKRIAEEEARRQEEEARRLAEEERQRELEAKRAEEERIRAEIEAKMRLEAEERARIAEAARMAVEEQKRLEAERAAKEERERREALEREAERLRKEEEARRLEEQRRREEQLRREEEERRRREEEEAKARVAIVTKQAKLLFRYAVDLNVVKRIKEVVEKTLVENNKEKLNIHIKAYPQDTNSIALEIKLPQNEMDLLVSMMKALGGASIGITKIILE